MLNSVYFIIILLYSYSKSICSGILAAEINDSKHEMIKLSQLRLQASDCTTFCSLTTAVTAISAGPIFSHNWNLRIYSCVLGILISSSVIIPNQFYISVDYNPLGGSISCCSTVDNILDIYSVSLGSILQIGFASGGDGRQLFVKFLGSYAIQWGCYVQNNDYSTITLHIASSYIQVVSVTGCSWGSSIAGMICIHFSIVKSWYESFTVVSRSTTDISVSPVSLYSVKSGTNPASGQIRNVMIYSSPPTAFPTLSGEV